MSQIEITTAPDPNRYPDLAQLLWEGFERKFRWPLRNADISRAFFTDTFVPDSLTAAVDTTTGATVGVMVTSDPDHRASTNELAAIRRQFFLPEAAIRLAILSLLDPPLRPNELYVNSLVVSDKARGQGVGSALLNHADRTTEQRGLATVSLDVIDSNPGARRLYERQGFRVTGTYPRIGRALFRGLFGFDHYHRMAKPLATADEPPAPRP